MTSVVAVFMLTVAGLPLGWALTRSLPLAVLLAPLAGAAVSAVAVLLMLWLRGPLIPWFAAVLAASVAVAWLVRRAAPAPGGSWREAGLLGVPLLPPMLLMFRDPVAWDAHAIWWLHAGYFARGGDFARAAMGNAALVPSHPDYPPLASAPVGVAWRLLESYTFRPAIAVNVAVTWSAAVLVAYAVRRVTARAPWQLSIPAALGAACSAWLPQWTAPTEGYSDTMCAAAFVAGAVLLLAPREPLGVTPLALFLVAAAALTKNEGVALAEVFAVVASVRYRREIRRAAWCWLPAGAAAAWSLTARALGAENDLMAGGRFGALLRGDAGTWERLPLIETELGERIWPVAIAATVAAVLGGLLLRGRRRRLGLAGDGWLWAVLAAHWLMLTFIYLVTQYDIHWHLSTSVDRVTIVLAMLSCAIAATWLPVALAPVPRPAGEHGPGRHRRAADSATAAVRQPSPGPAASLER
ncbi:hypothetical protein [Dactylosporangium sp. CA-233914]|uniref:hypothetical protein n=1 Tax=Dactylosporangium sp. CA-233914 TaxID=3239934 RepID=UPI003D8FF63C